MNFGSGPNCRGVPPWAPALLLTTREERAPTEGRPYKLGNYRILRSGLE